MPMVSVLTPFLITTFAARFQRICDPSVTREPKNAIAWVVGSNL